MRFKRNNQSNGFFKHFEENSNIIESNEKDIKFENEYFKKTYIQKYNIKTGLFDKKSFIIYFFIISFYIIFYDDIIHSILYKLQF